jgi:hypothetical protein
MPRAAREEVIRRQTDFGAHRGRSEVRQQPLRLRLIQAPVFHNRVIIPSVRHPIRVCLVVVEAVSQVENLLVF